MNNVNKDKNKIKGICKQLGINLKIDNQVINTFNLMHWDTDNETHLFAFLSHLFLIDKFQLPIFYTSFYPESVIKGINTFKEPDNSKSLYALLTREFSIMDNENCLVELLTNFTLTFVELWKRYVNKNFV